MKSYEERKNDILKIVEIGFTYDSITDTIYSHKGKPVIDKQVRITKCKIRPEELYCTTEVLKHYFKTGEFNIRNDEPVRFKKEKIKNDRLPIPKIKSLPKPIKTIKKEGNNYVNDTTLLYEIIISKGKGKLTPYAEQAIILIAQELIKKFRFTFIDERNDAINEAIYSMLKGWKTFDENKYSKILPYFTECAKRAIVKSYNQYRWKYKQQELPKIIRVQYF